jgi:hypothetical protein
MVIFNPAGTGASIFLSDRRFFCLGYLVSKGFLAKIYRPITRHEFGSTPVKIILGVQPLALMP